MKKIVVTFGTFAMIAIAYHYLHLNQNPDSLPKRYPGLSALSLLRRRKRYLSV